MWPVLRGAKMPASFSELPKLEHPDRARRREYGLGAEGMVEGDSRMIVLALDIAAFVGLGAFVLLGLLIPLSAVWGEFLPQIGNFFDP